MPVNLYGDSRANSKGFDVYDVDKLTDLSKSINKWFDSHASNLVVSDKADYIVRNPANLSEIVGYHHFDTPAQMLAKLSIANDAFSLWSNTAVTERAEILMRVADLLERHMDELIGLCIKEAGKITEDSIDEVREAVDFARYYAVEAKKIDPDNRLTPRGVILCISPWNFPLAIFLGQVVAALSTGNTVIAKPAEQTSLIAIRALELMHSVGLPKDVLQMVIANGPQVGDTLLPDERIQGVMFTGSTQTGTLIARTLAQRPTTQVPLIAETGGQNCMIVDSTALPEQVVDDVVMSGFRSAGQRCSALRVLFVQDVVADDIIEMIIGAMKELSVGDPQWLSTDLGPVIDEKALKALNDHEAFMQENGKLLYKCEIDSKLDGTFFAPHLFEISDLSVLTKEVFGPCVHIVRFKGNELHKVMEQINTTGYGLTMGIHTRIEERAYELAQMSRAGNLYINRNMIGAIVGSQPFGGRGLSGTGPKAGGPNYLPRLMMEKVTPDMVDIHDDLADGFNGRLIVGSNIDVSDGIPGKNFSGQVDRDTYQLQREIMVDGISVTIPLVPPKVDFEMDGTRALNPFIQIDLETPYIPDLFGGAELFGLLEGVDAESNGVARFLGGAPTDATLALLRLDTGPGGYSDDFVGFDMLLFINMMDTVLADPMLGIVPEGNGDSFLIDLLFGGYMTDPTFGGVGGPQLLGGLDGLAI